MKKRQCYSAPSAEIVLFAPCEELALFGFHQDDSGYRWGLNGWVDVTDAAGMGDPSSGVIGTGFFENAANLNNLP